MTDGHVNMSVDVVRLFVIYLIKWLRDHAPEEGLEYGKVTDPSGA